MDMTMLWPNDLLVKTSSDPTIGEVLSQSSKDLAIATGGKLEAEVSSLSPVDNLFVYSFLIKPYGRPDYKFELFQLRAINGVFPVIIENYHLDERTEKAESPADMDRILRKVFSADTTKRILQTMAEEAQQPQGVASPPYFVGPGRWTMADGREFTTIVLNGLTGHVFVDDLYSLAAPAGNSNSAYKQLQDGRSIVTIKLSDPVKMTLVQKDAEWLRSQADAVLRAFQKEDAKSDAPSTDAELPT